MGELFTTSIDHISEFIATIFGYMGIFAIALGGMIALFLAAKSIFSKKSMLAEIRITMGQYLALGLEFLIGKDILESIINPSWDRLGKLAAIIAIRTVITFFLARELKEIKSEIEIEKVKRKSKKVN